MSITTVQTKDLATQYEERIKGLVVTPGTQTAWADNRQGHNSKRFIFVSL